MLGKGTGKPSDTHSWHGEHTSLMLKSPSSEHEGKWLMPPQWASWWCPRRSAGVIRPMAPAIRSVSTHWNCARLWFWRGSGQRLPLQFEWTFSHSHCCSPSTTPRPQLLIPALLLRCPGPKSGRKTRHCCTGRQPPQIPEGLLPGLSCPIARAQRVHLTSLWRRLWYVRYQGANHSAPCVPDRHSRQALPGQHCHRRGPSTSPAPFNFPEAVFNGIFCSSRRDPAARTFFPYFSNP